MRAGTCSAPKRARIAAARGPEVSLLSSWYKLGMAGWPSFTSAVAAFFAPVSFFSY